ncbi:MAG: hypothetical protein ACJ796_00290 [Gemmatimonadaceae bacterium]
MRRFHTLAILIPSLCPLALALGQKPPDRPPIDLSAPENIEQPSKGDPFSGSLFGDWGVPVGAFHRNEDGGVGLGFHGAYALDAARHFALRLEAGFLGYGYVSRDLDVPAYDENGNYIGYENVSYAAREHQMYSLDFGPEVTALSGMVRPYGFVTGGLSYFVSKVNIRPPQYSGDDGLDQTVFSAGNFAWSTGLGLRIGSHDPRSGLFDIGIRFRRNARAHYANDKSLSSQADGSLSVTPFYGSANLVTIYAGFWIGPKRRR